MEDAIEEARCIGTLGEMEDGDIIDQLHRCKDMSRSGDRTADRTHHGPGSPVLRKTNFFI